MPARIGIVREREAYVVATTGFVRAVEALAGDPRSDVAEGLLERWREPHRGYHDERHLAEVLSAVEVLGSRPVTVLAAWYHDAVYEGRPGEDEEASARLAEEELAALGVEEREVAEVARLVRSTAAHELPTDGDSDEAVLHDADLWILATPAERFDEYCSDVRREYAHVDDADYRRGRTAVLTPFVTRPRLYATEHAHELWTDAARDNLRRELGRLR
ncbi:hypothetical protein GCM10022199_22380 [Marihabitans asiaticum]